MTSPLRIGWAAPWNKNSTVAQSASDVAVELARRGHAVTVLRTETGVWAEGPVHEAPGEVRWLKDCSASEIVKDFDAVVGHFGNHFGLHGALVPRLRDVAMVGIFYDAAVVDLLAGWVMDEKKVRDDAIDMMRRLVWETYGEDAAVDRSSLDDVSTIARDHPMIEWMARQTVGAVAHAEHDADRLRSACPGRTAVIPFAVQVGRLPPPPPPWDRTIIAVVGDAEPDERIDQIILALAASQSLLPRCRVRVIGEARMSERDRLDALAKDLGVEPPEYTGPVNDDDLKALLRDVDVMSCLRSPTLEGAPASLVFALTTGRPTLVGGGGPERGIPSDAAMFCSPEHEGRDILLHLERVVQTPQLGLEIGARGRHHALSHHTPNAFANALEPLVRESIARQPALAARRQLSESLGEFGLMPFDPAITRLGDKLSAFAS